AGNPLLISLERLVQHGWLDTSRLNGIPEGIGLIDYDGVRAYKLPLLTEAAANFLHRAQGNARDRFNRFCGENAWWLEDFVLFDALRERYVRTTWNHWPSGVARREAAALDTARHELANEMNMRRAIQFMFYEQWRALRVYCGQRSIRVVGDIAIFVDY